MAPLLTSLFDISKIKEQGALMNKAQFPRKNSSSLASLEGALIPTVKTSDPEIFQNTFLVAMLKKPILLALRIFLQIPFYPKTSGL